MWTVLAYIAGVLLLCDGLRDPAGRGWPNPILLLCAAVLTLPITFDLLKRATGWGVSTRVRIITVVVLVALYGLPNFVDAARAIWSSAREHRAPSSKDVSPPTKHDDKQP